MMQNYYIANMGHGNVWLFNMEMCCRSNEDYLFDCMNLYARLKEDGKVVVEGVVFYWNPVDGDTQKSAVIRSFKDIDECLNWINSESSARDECVEVLNEHC